MGISGIGITQLVIILAIVLLLFGSKKLGSLGADLGDALKGFRDAITKKKQDEDSKEDRSNEKITDI